MNGASNTWIARKTIQIIENIRPKCIVIHWSYLHRREDKDESLSDEGRILHQQYNTFEEDYLLLGNQIQSITTFANKYGTKILHSFIPFVVSKIDTKLFSSVLVDMKIVQENYIVLDIARDGHHYGIKTAEMFTDSIVKSFQNI